MSGPVGRNSNTGRGDKHARGVYRPSVHELLDTTENIERQLAIRKAQEQERERAARREGRTQ
jgi:hypothetical protein